MGEFLLLSPGIPSEVPCLGDTAHTGLAERAAGCPHAAPEATPGERWDPGSRPADKARKLLLLRHFRGGHDFHNNKHI